MTHPEFAQAVMKEWGLTPMKLRQACCCQWYIYLTKVNDKDKIIGKYTIINSEPMFVLIKKDESEVYYKITPIN